MLTNLGNRGFGPSHQWKMMALFSAGVLLLVLALAVETAASAEIDGFTEPFRTVRIAAAETGIVTKIQVREGDVVQIGQVVATLDDDVHLALLAIAKSSMEGTGQLNAALAERQLLEERLRKFESLRASGHARQEEVDRTRTELAIADGQVTSAEEDLLIKQLEYEKIKTQLERRSVRSPMTGVVSELHKEAGEFVAPNTPEILTVVELDPLLAVFSLLPYQAHQLQVGQAVRIRFSESNRTIEGVVEFIAPVTNAESGTVRAKVRIPNSEGTFRSGERCVIEINGPKQGRS